MSRRTILAYEEFGQGRVLVLLHAFPLSRKMWEPQARALQSKFRVITPDLPGFGESNVVPAVSIDAMADHVAVLLDQLGVREPIILGGLSMGSYVALAFARRHAAKLAVLVLADSRAEPDTDEGKVAREATLEMVRKHPEGDAKPVGRLVFEGMKPKAFAPTSLENRKEVVDRLTAIAAEQSRGGIIAAVQALRDRPDARPGLAAIEVPTLILVGEEDGITPPHFAETLAEGIPNSTLIAIAQSGHFTNAETPDEFNESVREFLSGVHSNR